MSILWSYTQLHGEKDGIIYRATSHYDEGEECWTVIKWPEDKPMIPPHMQILTENGWEYVLLSKSEYRYLHRSDLDNIDKLGIL